MATQTAKKTNTRSRTQSQTQAEKPQVQEVAERTVDVPVGVAMTVVDRFQELIDPWTSRNTAERELRSYRTQLTRRVNRAQRRGATARRKATTQAKRTRTRFEREVRRVEREARKNQRKAGTRLRQNRRKVETQLRKVSRRAEKVQADVQETVESQASRAQEFAGQVSDQVASLV